MPMLTDMHEYNSMVSEGSALPELYRKSFHQAFPDAFAGQGWCHTCNSFVRYAEQLKRFRLDCDIGLLSIVLRAPELGEHWTVSVAEGFIDYLSRQTTPTKEAYGINVLEILAHVAKFAAANDSFLLLFMPPEIFTEEWIQSIEEVPSILVHHQLDEARIVNILEREPFHLSAVPPDRMTISMVLAAARKNLASLHNVPHSLKFHAIFRLCNELCRENRDLKAQLEVKASV